MPENRKPFIEIDAANFTISPYKTKATKGYVIPKNETTGKQLPFCCAFHKKAYENANKWFKTFPNCCEPHRAMQSMWWFKKDIYKGLPIKIVSQLSYTEHHILQNIDANDWYEDITEYIEYNQHSFGHPAIGLNHYLGNIKHFITESKKEKLTAEKRKRLLDFIESYYTEPKSESISLTQLYEVYSRWLNIFPFEISYFKHLKEYFEKQIPVLNGTPEKNRYSGIATVKMQTKESLVAILIKTTNDLLTQINGVKLYEDGIINDANKIKLELLINSRKLKLKDGYNNNLANEELQYKEMLSEWFHDEQIFWNSITPLLNMQSDEDFITGKIHLSFTPQGNDGYFVVSKEQTNRKYTLQQYFDLNLRNWETEIDKAHSKDEKLKIANNAIFTFRKDWLDWQHPKIQLLKEEKIQHLKHIIEYINSNFEEVAVLSEPQLQLREIALLCYFNNEKITIGNQDTFASKYHQKNTGKKLFSEHYKRITEDEKEIYQHKYSKKYLENIKPYITNTEAIKKIDFFLKKCN
ncbi:MAG: hypothetical protein WAQ28_11905 [Bacteroidia bacterium]